MNGDPAVDAARRAWAEQGWGPGEPELSEGRLAEASAREALAPIRAELEAIKQHWGQVQDRWLAAETPAEQSRHFNEMVGIQHVYDRVCRLVYTEAELAQ